MNECTVCHKTYASKSGLRKHVQTQHPQPLHQALDLRVYNDAEKIGNFIDQKKGQLDVALYKKLKKKVDEVAGPKLIVAKRKGVEEKAIHRVRPSKRSKSRLAITYPVHNPLIPTGSKRKTNGQGGVVKRFDRSSEDSKYRVPTQSLIPTGSKRRTDGQGGAVKRFDRSSEDSKYRAPAQSLAPTETKRTDGQDGAVKRLDRSTEDSKYRVKLPAVSYPKSLWFQCNICEKKFSNNKLLADHLVKEHPTCPKCHEVFADMKTYEEHWRNNHLEHQCPLCNKMFPTDARLNQHLEEHPRCTECDQVFLDKSQFEKHWDENHSQAPEQTDESDLSDNELPGPSKMTDSETEDEYMDASSEKEDPTKYKNAFRCKTCPSTFTTKEELVEHIDLDHPKCKICKKRFTNEARYLNHYQGVHENKEEPFEEELPPASEDEVSDVEDPRAELKREDRQFHKHINCVTIDRFLEIRSLVDNNQFDAIAGNTELLQGLQIIMKGVIKGFIPICSSQRFVMSKEMKVLMYRFAKSPSSTILLRNKQNIKMLFNVLWSSVKTVIESFLKYDN